MKTIFMILLTGLIMMNTANAEETSDQTLRVAQSFLEAAGSGDVVKLNELMSDDFVWHNEGDTNVPWIGNWQGKETVLTQFLPAFSAGLKVTSWTTDYSFVNGNQAVFIGSMSAITTHSGVDTGSFSWAVRVHVEGNKVKSWNWFEDGYALSKAYNSKQ
jgi:ketosteroid isomerase-like protein